VKSNFENHKTGIQLFVKHRFVTKCSQTVGVFSLILFSDHKINFKYQGRVFNENVFPLNIAL